MPEAAPPPVEPPPPQSNGVPPPQPSDAVVPDAPKPAKARDLAQTAAAQHAARRIAERAKKEATEATARAQAEATRAAGLEKELAELRARLKTEALVVAAEHGGDPAANIEGYVARSTPEAQIKGAHEELAKLRKELADKDARQEQAAREHHARAMQQAKAAALQQFVKEVTGSEKEYPHLNSEFEPEAIQAHAARIAQWAEENQTSYSFKEVAEFLEKQAKLVHDRRAERRKTLLTPQEEGDSGPAPRDSKRADPGNGHRDSRPATRTSPNGAQRSQRRPLTREEEEAEDLAILKAAMAKDEASRAVRK